MNFLLPSFYPEAVESIREGKDSNFEDVEREASQKAIDKHNGHISCAARELDLGRTTLYRKMNK